MTLLQEAETGVFADLYQKIMQNPEASLLSSNTLAYEIIFGTPYVPAVYAADQSVAIFNAKKRGECNWGIVPETYFPSGYGIAMPELTPFKTTIDTT